MNTAPRFLWFGAILCLLLISAVCLPEQEPSTTLFDGKTLKGWSFQEAEAQWWSVQDGLLTGGSLTEQVPYNTFLQTEESFQNFDLSFQVRIQSAGGFANSGMQIRSQRVSGSSEMVGYQVDAGDDYWGHLYDESRRGRIQIAEKAEEVVASIHDGAWNSYRIRANGPRIQSWINGIASTDYIEKLTDIPLDGHIALQVHGGGKVQVQLKDIEIERLPKSVGVMTWKRLHEIEASREQGVEPWRSPQEEQALFILPDGFEIELVASEEHVQKLVDIAFDDHGRMWGLTAAEYPIDANEDPAAAAKYQGGSKDQVVVFDNIWSKEIQRPRIFADGFAMPMAILPEGDSVLLAHGPEILRLYDDNGDGKSDRREVILDGFGIQDSHLMPHRFVQAPGGWVYVAQGAFNASEVRTKDGALTTFNKCKLGRFRRDGSAFEIVGVGLNNIWGFILDRRGDMWIQEANDLGYPIVPFYHGASYPGIGSERFHSASPWQPPISTVTMGGTGLSGLAQSQDRNGFPAPWDQRYLVANPIINLVQSLEIESVDMPHERQVRLKEDLISTSDKNFRPVAIHFGPDGCLYIVDWYNPIISHNEVSRDHADRDKKSTRIWRVRHESQSKDRPVDVAGVATKDLPELLDSESTWISRAAWHQIAAREAKELGVELTALAQDKSRNVEARILALWSLEDLGSLTEAIVRIALQDEEASLAREGARMSAALDLDGVSLVVLLAAFTESEHGAVRRAAIASLAGCNRQNEAVSRCLLQFLRDPLDGPTVGLRQGNDEVLTGKAAEIAFERSLIRIALENRGQELSAAMTSGGLQNLPLETQIFATLCQGGEVGAKQMAGLLMGLERRPRAEELAFVIPHAELPVVEELLFHWLDSPALQEETLRSLLLVKPIWEKGRLTEHVASSLRALMETNLGPSAQLDLAMSLAQSLRLSELEPDIIGWMDRGYIGREAGLRSLIEMSSSNVELFQKISASSVPGSQVRRLAIGALASVNHKDAFAQLLLLWPTLEKGARKSAITEVLASPEGAARILTALEKDVIALGSLDGIAWARLEDHLGQDPRLRALRTRAATGRIASLRFAGGGADFVDTDLTIDGPFTMESWMYLEPGISSDDSLLALPGQFDFNFWDGYARLWGGPQIGDVIIATQRAPEERWFHIALTRTDSGILSLYIDGELNQTSTQTLATRIEDLDIGRSSGARNTHGRMVEVRLWNVARSAAEVGSTFRRSFSEEEKIDSLIFSSTRQEVKCVGEVAFEPAFDPPPLQTAAEIEAEVNRFNRFRLLANTDGDLERGGHVFAASCLVCHRVNGEGGAIGPVLDGVGAKGVEGMLRSILTPNAGVESGYRTLMVQTHDGQLLAGFLAGEDGASISIRRLGREDLVLPRSEIKSMRFDSRSLMPEGLLDGLDEQSVSDLFEYLKSQ